MTAVGPSTTPNSGGQSSIQILLDAEKEASNRVQEARQCKILPYNHSFHFPFRSSSKTERCSNGSRV